MPLFRQIKLNYRYKNPELEAQFTYEFFKINRLSQAAYMLITITFHTIRLLIQLADAETEPQNSFQLPNSFITIILSIGVIAFRPRHFILKQVLIIGLLVSHFTFVLVNLSDIEQLKI